MKQKKQEQKIIIISGPTASGKSSLAIEIAQDIDGVIINADSMQIYQDLPILSSQPTKEDLSYSEHKLYSIINYKQNFSVQDWLKLTQQEIEQSFKQNKIPIIVGGTGMYIAKLVNGISKVPDISAANKKYCSDIWQNFGRDAVIKSLQEYGDNSNIIHDLDQQRLLRRLAVIKETGKSLSYWQSLGIERVYNQEQFIHINLEIDRDILYRNCNERFVAMIDNGAMLEVEQLLENNINQDHNICNTIGFIEIKNYLTGKINEIEMIEKAAQRTRNYAKRQLTWFRHQFENKSIINNVSRETINKIKDQIIK